MALATTLNVSHVTRLLFRVLPENMVTGVIISTGSVSVCERETAKNPLCRHERPEETLSVVGRVARINTRVFYVNQLNGFGPPWMVRLSLTGTFPLNPWHLNGRVSTGETEWLRGARLLYSELKVSRQTEKINSRKVDGVSS